MASPCILNIYSKYLKVVEYCALRTCEGLPALVPGFFHRLYNQCIILSLINKSRMSENIDKWPSHIQTSKKSLALSELPKIYTKAATYQYFP